MSGQTVAAALREARSHGVAVLDARLMLARLIGMTRSELIAHDDRLLDDAASQRWQAWLQRRSAGEPLAYLLGEKEFHGLMLEVTPDVLVPRPETELLVDWAVACVDRCDADRAASVVDLGTGSGAIALAIKHDRPAARVAASDVSVAALDVARRNAQRTGLDIEFAHASWWQAFAGRSFHIAVSNPPYVREGDPALLALGHEPLSALTPGGDGTAALTAIVAGAAGRLHGEAWLLLEHGFDQGAFVRGLLQTSGFVQVETRRDLAGHERASGGRRPAR